LQAGAPEYCGQRDAKSGASSGRALNRYVAVMLLHYAVGHSQPQSRAAPHALSGKERIVNLGYVFRRDAYAVVYDLYLY
jgi:hypothetical protein